MQVPIYNLAAEIVRQIDISDRVFGVPFNEGVVHQAMVRQRANARHGTSSTKTRSEVTGTSKKMYRQKGTGNARAGSRRSPVRRGGGIAFGPRPRSYHQEMPKKMRRLAIKCMLSAKAGDGEMKILEALKFDEPKTKLMVQMLNAFEIQSPSLVVTSEPEESVVKSARNLPGIKTMPANLLSVLDLLSYKTLFITEAAVRRIEQLWGTSEGGNDASLRGAAPSADN